MLYVSLRNKSRVYHGYFIVKKLVHEELLVIHSNHSSNHQHTD